MWKKTLKQWRDNEVSIVWWARELAYSRVGLSFWRCSTWLNIHGVWETTAPFSWDQCINPGKRETQVWVAALTVRHGTPLLQVSALTSEPSNHYKKGMHVCTPVCVGCSPCWMSVFHLCFWSLHYHAAEHFKDTEKILERALNERSDYYLDNNLKPNPTKLKPVHSICETEMQNDTWISRGVTSLEHQ